MAPLDTIPRIVLDRSVRTGMAPRDTIPRIVLITDPSNTILGIVSSIPVLTDGNGTTIQFLE